LFARTYLDENGPVDAHDPLDSHDPVGTDDGTPALVHYRVDEEHTAITLRVDGVEHTHRTRGAGPVESLTAALAAAGAGIEVLSLHQTSVEAGVGSDALTLIEYRGDSRTAWAAGRARSVLDATFAAVLRAAGRPRG
jgi:2-isopropylmalate synthase